MISSTRDALVQMSVLFYEEYGRKSLPIISKIWYELGQSTSARLSGNPHGADFKSVATNFYKRGQENASRTNTAPPELEELTDSTFHYSHVQDQCPLGLKNRDLCEAIMCVDKGQIEAAIGNSVEFEIIQSAAAGDGCCEIVVKDILKNT